MFDKSESVENTSSDIQRETVSNNEYGCYIGRCADENKKIILDTKGEKNNDL